MTKTLTEQWREGKIKEGYYYTLLNTDSKMIEINYCWDDGCFQDYCDNMIDEVLAPVPSYDEFVQQRDFVKDHLKVLIENMNLKRKLEIATKALNDILNDGDDYWDKDKAQEALTKMEGVK